jgi:hypothetical protein
MVLSSIVQFIAFFKEQPVLDFFDIPDSEKPSIVVVLCRNENQRTVVDSSYFKNTKEPTIYLYNIFSLSDGGRLFHPSVLSSVPLSIHSTSSSWKKKMMEKDDDESSSSKLKFSN